MKSKIQEAIERGKAKNELRVTVAKQNAKQMEAKRAKVESECEERITKALKTWVEDELPLLIEKCTAEGEDYFTVGYYDSNKPLSMTKLGFYLDDKLLSRLMKLVEKTGLKVEAEFHTVPESTDWDFRHDAYSYHTYTVRW